MFIVLAEIQYYSPRSIIPLLVISGKKLSALSLIHVFHPSPFSISDATLGQIECDSHNWTKRRSRFDHSSRISAVEGGIELNIGSHISYGM